MFAFVFSCVTTSTVAGNSTLPLTWSPCVWVLMIVVTGFGVSSLILSRIGWPQPGFFVSTTTTPVAGDEDGGVAAAAASQHEQVVLELLDFDDSRGLRLLSPGDGKRSRAGRHQYEQVRHLVS